MYIPKAQEYTLNPQDYTTSRDISRSFNVQKYDLKVEKFTLKVQKCIFNHKIIHQST